MPSTAPEPVTGTPVEVAVGLIRDADGRVLVTRRRAGRHLEGFWEFPGGKVAPGETPAAALARELDEELGIRVHAATHCLSIPHDYPERRVILRVFRVADWTGQPAGREGQPLEWRAPQALEAAEFPAANGPMLAALTLPATCLVTPSPRTVDEIGTVVARVGQALASAQAGMVQVRAPHLERDDYLELLAAVLTRAEPQAIPVLANAPPPWLAGFPQIGLHLPERRWRELDARPQGFGRVALSVHDRAGLERAAALGADFAVLSPVEATATHPGAKPLGWERFTQLVRGAALPVYALGGMDTASLPQAQAAGAQGIAAIRGLLGD
ncbi:Nudix family hydrolase [Thioalkalivibrio sp. ALJ16]|uniref:Nudix family hydrolase n=1 Tax=Thioalkalivibrio sp. ALJ16 TaxID=1158762 RepID=UPI000381FE3B|nr:Nudix family hydrolase [Thioalkalivibrio sp. ALJ16]